MSPPDLARATGAITALTLVSRATGFVRIVVVAAVLGDTFLGNTYQSANTVPNLLFEVFAAGVLQAALIPTLVDVSLRDQREADHVARSVLGLATVVLSGLAVLGVLIAPWFMGVMVSGVADPQVRDAQVQLGTVLLWFFLPQMALYGVGMVATAVLHSRGRFVAPAAAPIANNVVVIGAYLLFARLAGGGAPGLTLSGVEQVVLGLGTTLGVLALAAVPFVAAARAGTTLVPRFDFAHAAVRQVVKRGSWAAVFLIGAQVLIAVVLVLANRVEGGVVAYQVAYALFLLPYALFALPILSALFPLLARHGSVADLRAWAGAVASGARAIVFFGVPAAFALAVLAGPVSDVIAFGRLTPQGAAEVARVAIAFAPGLVGYGLFLFLSRAIYGLGDTRTPALVHLGVVACGAPVMILGFFIAGSGQRVAALALGHSFTYLVGVVVLVLVVRAKGQGAPFPAVGSAVAVAVPAGAVAALGMVVVVGAIDAGSRLGAMIEVAGAGIVGVSAYLVASLVLGGPRWSDVVDLLRGEGSVTSA